MSHIEVTTQAQLNAALKKAGPLDIIVCVGSGYFELPQVTASDSAQVTAYGSAQVTASDSAQVRAYGSAQVTASGSAQVTAYDSAQVTAYDSAQVTASGSAQVTASKYVAVTVPPGRWNKPEVSGGVLIEVPEIKTAKQWCDYYGVSVVRGVATLFKGLDDDFSTDNGRRNGVFYTPGTAPAAPDWDPKPECGGGLHFSPRPVATLVFNPGATHFVACPVRLRDIVVHLNGVYPNKVKAPRVSGPCVEVDRNGDPIVAKAAAA